MTTFSAPCWHTFYSLRLIQVFVSKHYLAIVSEFVVGESVSDYLTSPGVRTTARCRAFFQQLILAIEYCHSRVRPLLSIGAALMTLYLEKTPTSHSLLPVENRHPELEDRRPPAR